MNKTLLMIAMCLCLAISAWAQDAADEFELENFAGSVVLVDFWASWCVPCQYSLPWLNAMQEKYGDQGLQVVTINLDRKPAAAAKMAGNLAEGIRQFGDPEGELAARYELEGMPSSYLYDREGQLITSHVGFLKADSDKHEAEIEHALEGKQQ